MDLRYEDVSGVPGISHLEREGTLEGATGGVETKDQDQLTPEEHLEYGYQKVREDLKLRRY